MRTTRASDVCPSRGRAVVSSRGEGSSLGLGKQDASCFREVLREAVRLPQVAVPPLDRAGRVGVQVRRPRAVTGYERDGAELSDPGVAALGPPGERFVVHVRSVVGRGDAVLPP